MCIWHIGLSPFFSVITCEQQIDYYICEDMKIQIFLIQKTQVYQHVPMPCVQITLEWLGFFVFWFCIYSFSIKSTIKNKIIFTVINFRHFIRQHCQ